MRLVRILKVETCSIAHDIRFHDSAWFNVNGMNLAYHITEFYNNVRAIHTDFSYPLLF